MSPNLKDRSVDRFRPQFHFTARRNWINDPNGLVAANGWYHLHYQHNPTGNEWGNIHWGHARSRDLLRWEHLPVNLHAQPEGLGWVYSGCAVRDARNTSGFGRDGRVPLVALYTHSDVRGVQRQSLAYSLDDARTWTEYVGNPVIDNPGLRDFRDPKVFWHEASARWIMLLAAADRILIYVSSDLRRWRARSEVVRTVDALQGEWECPDLFPLGESADRLWVLLVSINPVDPARCSGVQYQVGAFDGECFRPKGPLRLLDHGPDHYATVSWDGDLSSKDRRLVVGWMSNQRYANSTPTYPWRGAMTMPRQLRMATRDGIAHLAALPVEELSRLRNVDDAVELRGEAPPFSVPNELADLDLRFTWETDDPPDFGLQFAGASDAVTVVLSPRRRLLEVDRRRVGQHVPDARFAQVYQAPLYHAGKAVSLRVVRDVSSIEVLADEGVSSITALLFPDDVMGDVRFIGMDGETVRVSGTCYPLRSALASG